MSHYLDTIGELEGVVAEAGSSWADINPEYAARMRAQNRFMQTVQSTACHC